MRLDTPKTDIFSPASARSPLSRPALVAVEYEDSESLDTNPLSELSDESIESEISDLTWAVLDGRATPDERKKLSELVSLQHQRRELPGK